MSDSRTSNPWFRSPQRFFLDAPKQQPGTCFVLNDDYLEAVKEIERLQQLVHSGANEITRLNAALHGPHGATVEPKAQCICGTIKNTVMGCPACDPVSTAEPPSIRLSPAQEPAAEIASAIRDAITGLQAGDDAREFTFRVKLNEHGTHDFEVRECPAQSPTVFLDFEIAGEWHEVPFRVARRRVNDMLGMCGHWYPVGSACPTCGPAIPAGSAAVFFDRTEEFKEDPEA
jgi:hypothetical protein